MADYQKVMFHLLSNPECLKRWVVNLTEQTHLPRRMRRVKVRFWGKNQTTALKELRGLDDEVILPADKGNATVMKKCDYDGKMEELLGMGIYVKLRGDRTAS